MSGPPSPLKLAASRVPVRLMALALLLGVAGMAGTAALSAHDLWIEPSAFTPQQGTRLAVRLRYGQGFRGDPFPRDPRYLVRFAVIPGAGTAGEQPIAGLPGVDPAGFLQAGRPGLYLLVYRSSHASLELDAEKFEKYLAEEGLERVSAERARRGQSASPGKEIYSRCAKSLIVIRGVAGPGSQSERAGTMPGDQSERAGTTSGAGRIVGFPLELVPEQNPYALEAGAGLPVRLLYEGKPLAGAKIAAISKDHPEAGVAARSDGAGRARLTLPRGGAWLVKAVHMVAAPPGSGADWESFWASLTFDLPGRRAPIE
ncbi:MAG TPA: DUF4198 domain-containing protein [Thermoanaerobaculia bacterium]|nr:DUF4198 domain-containing protein [Thermoanaerobaculia bacterium]